VTLVYIPAECVRGARRERTLKAERLGAGKRFVDERKRTGPTSVYRPKEEPEMSEGAVKNAEGDRVCYAVIRKGVGGEWVDLGTLTWDIRGTQERNRRLEEHLSATGSGRSWLKDNPVARTGTFTLAEGVNARGEKGVAINPRMDDDKKKRG
jgi:hypothetical protein